jgi:tetratricopeptide (TPR) repeat protein
MKALPKTRYVTVAGETWGLIRGAYLSGLSAPTVAARFGVSVTALRKHAAKEGWTKRAFAARQALARSAPPPGAAAAAPAATATDGPPDEAAVLAAWRAPLHIRPDDLARRALANAAHALKTGEGLNAVRLARAATEIARLNDVLEWAEEDPAEADARFESGQAMMRMFLRERALILAQDLIAGRDLPPEYADLKLELARLEVVRAAEGEGAKGEG